MSTPARPDLKFDSMDAMLADAERLKTGGYEQAGQWTLGMVLDHLTKTMSVPFAPGRTLPWPASAIGRLVVHGFAKRDRYPSVKFPAMPFQRPTPGIDLATAYDAFRSASERVKGVTGDTVGCPPLGPLPVGDFVAVQLLHGAHHLGYLKPANV